MPIAPGQGLSRNLSTLVARHKVLRTPANANGRRFRAAALIALLLVAAACSPGAPDSSDTPAAGAHSAVRPAAPAADASDHSNPPPPPYPVAEGDIRFMPLPLPGWHVATLEMDPDSAPDDIGHGVLYVVERFDTITPYPRVDTIFFHAGPDSTTALAGAVVTNLRGSGWALFTDIWAPDSLLPNWVEFGYEEGGIPYDSVTADGRWHRAILGFTATREPRYGWAALGDSVLDRVTWKEKLIDMTIYFRDFDSGTFHAEPDGPVVATPRIFADSGFDITSVEARWPWLRVKIEHPGATCEGDLPPDRRTDYFWVRALDDRGRPLVFYPTRGC